jgi:acyl-CoA synthetase (AMP-forming)/AMP-acid ligase II
LTNAPATLVDALRHAAAVVGDRTGYTFYESPTSSSFLGYAELDRRARLVAVDLRARGFAEGDTVVLAINPSFAFIETLFGALYAGLIVAPAAMAGIGSTATTERLAGMVRTAGARAILTERDMVDAFADDARQAVGVPLLDAADLVGGSADDWVAPAVTAESVAFLLFTSGSTGDPKGVIVTHGGSLASADASAELADLDAESVYAGWAPVHHTMGLAVQIILPLRLTGTAVLTSTAQFQRRPVFWLQLLSRHRATYSVAGNFAFDLVTQLTTDEQLAELDLSAITCLMTGSEPVRTDTVHRFVERFSPRGLRADVIAPAYGSTEGSLMTVKPPHTDLFIVDVDADQLEAGILTPTQGGRTIEMVSCGVAARGTSLKIVDPETELELEDGRIGEIWFAGPAVSPGYWRNAEATAETFGRTLPGDPALYNRTGDLGGVVRGEIFITGRVKDLIIIRGRNIYPQDLESAAARVTPGIAISAAFELQGHPSDAGIVLEYDPELVAAEDLAQLGESVRGVLIKDFSLPSIAIAFVAPGGVPRTASGKVRRAATRALLESGALSTTQSTGFAAVR